MEMLKADKNVEELLNSIEELMTIPDEKLNENMVDMVLGAFKGAFTEQVKEETILELMEQIKTNSSFNINDWKNGLEEAILSLFEEYDNVSPLKEKLVRGFFNLFIELIEEAANRVGKYDTIVSFELVHPNEKFLLMRTALMLARMYMRQRML